jgi:hypothetical protein
VKKIDLVEQLLNDGSNKNGAQLSVIPGKTEYFKVEIFNRSGRPETYTHSI